MATENSKFCGKHKYAETYIVVLSWGNFEGSPVTKVRKYYPYSSSLLFNVDSIFRY